MNINSSEFLLMINFFLFQVCTICSDDERITVSVYRTIYLYTFDQHSILIKEKK